MPEILRLATADKAALEKTVKSVMASQGFTNAASVMAILVRELES